MKSGESEFLHLLYAINPLRIKKASVTSIFIKRLGGLNLKFTSVTLVTQMLSKHPTCYSATMAELVDAQR